MKTLCIAGKNDIAINVLKYALKRYNNTLHIIAILNKTETGKNSWQRSYKVFCEENNVPIVKLEDVYDIEDLYFISLEFDKLIKTRKFRSDKLYNIHFSKLPAYKGMYTSALPLINDEPEGGVTFHKIRDGIDTGEIIEQSTFPIDFYMTGLDYYKNCIRYGTELVIKNLDDVLNDRVVFHKQPALGSSYYSRKAIDYSNLQLDVNKTACEVHNQIRAFAFRPYQLLKICDSPILNSEITNEISEEKPGTVIEEDDISIKITTIDYNLNIYKDTLQKLLSAIRNNDNNKAKYLCTCHTVINEQEEHGWSPLIVAAYNGNFEMIKYLLEHGANIHAVNHHGTTVLMYAKEYYKRTNDRTIFDFLKENGADIDARDYSGKSLYDYCKEENLMALCC